MQAPSERHLEDWIVANPPIELGIGEIVGRQMKMPTGIADLITFSDGLKVVELKKGAIDSHSIAQVLSYIRSLNALYMEFHIEAASWKDHSRHRLPFSWRTLSSKDLRYIGYENVEGILIGNGLKDINLIYTCDVCMLSVYSGTTNKLTVEKEMTPFKLKTDHKQRKRHHLWTMIAYLRALQWKKS